MNLNPPNYSCPDHGDLTAQVTEAVEELGPPRAYRLPGARRGPRPFEVIVTCRGDRADPATAHDLAFTGQFTP